MNRELINITPEMAQEWLDSQTGNRPIKQDLVDRIATDMSNDNFDREHTFVVLTDNKLFYCQHTLSAIVQRNEAYDVYVVTLDRPRIHPRGFLNRKSKYVR